MGAKEQAAALHDRLCVHLEDFAEGRIDRVLYAVRAGGVYAAARAQGPEVVDALGALLEGDLPAPRSIIG